MHFFHNVLALNGNTIPEFVSLYYEKYNKKCIPMTACKGSQLPGLRHYSNGRSTHHRKYLSSSDPIHRRLKSVARGKETTIMSQEWGFVKDGEYSIDIQVKTSIFIDGLCVLCINSLNFLKKPLIQDQDHTTAWPNTELLFTSLLRGRSSSWRKATVACHRSRSKAIVFLIYCYIWWCYRTNMARVAGFCVIHAHFCNTYGKARASLSRLCVFEWTIWEK